MTVRIVISMCTCRKTPFFSRHISLTRNSPHISDSDLHKLAVATRRRQRQAFRPGTITNHRSQITLYLAFCIYYQLQDINPEVATMCMYCEFLARSFNSPKAIHNYVSGVRLLHKYVHVDSPSLHAFELDLILRSLNITMRHIPNQRLPISVAMLHQLITLCNSLGHLGLVLKCAILLGYFGFLRQSNLAPASHHAFDPTRHTCRADVIYHPPPGLVIILKWTKTMQSSSRTHLVPIPAISHHPLCPVQAFRDMDTALPAPAPNSPLLLLTDRQNRLVPLGLDKLNKAFKVLISSAGYSSDQYSFHSLRRSGATTSYHAGIDFTHIKRHGAWNSDAFWEYISADATQSPVPKALADVVTAYQP